MANGLSFQVFWDAYALKRDRIAAERAWRKLSEKDRRAAVEGINAYREDCERNGIRRMYAQGYLNHRRWEDDFTSGETQRSTSNSQRSTSNSQRSTSNSQLSIFNSQLLTSNSQLHNAPLPHSTAQLAEARRDEVRELSRIATESAAALASLVGGCEDE